VIGEAISNSWDAGAENVWITINREKNYFVIRDDGIGMSKEDYNNANFPIPFPPIKGLSFNGRIFGSFLFE
jgi:hypothetical protein